MFVTHSYQMPVNYSYLIILCHKSCIIFQQKCFMAVPTEIHTQDCNKIGYLDFCDIINAVVVT